MRVEFLIYVFVDNLITQIAVLTKYYTSFVDIRAYFKFMFGIFAVLLFRRLQNTRVGWV